MAHTALEVARWFLAYNRNEEDERGAERISNLKLQKLLYYAQGCYLALYGKPLFSDDIVAWTHGPVVVNVYHAYKANGANGIPFTEDFDMSQFSDEENDVLTQVYNTFGQYSAWKLRDMTHAEEPWLSTKQECVISNQKIRDYFQKKYIE